MIDGKEVKVGDKIRLNYWPISDYLVFENQKDENLFGFYFKDERDIHYLRCSYFLNSDWEFYQEPKPKKLVAPAIVKGAESQGRYFMRLSDWLYSSEEAAKIECGNVFISWPAVPNTQGFFEVPE